MDPTSFHLRIEFSNYEKSFLTEHLQSYLPKIKHYSPSADFKTPNMSTHHEILQFKSTPETLIPAFQLFQLKINLTHSFNPPELYFSASLQNAKDFSPNCYQLINPFQPEDSSFDANGQASSPIHLPSTPD